ncbi:MAG: hypothetical protein LAT68_02175 [Cyclobacteriaceae bacterium]|nr:hypothetical protein [Cyclobacteriaceae bacterium]MCH8515111.1 hypothetical protein [Cyclobacteriaceae bacterium]
MSQELQKNRYPSIPKSTIALLLIYFPQLAISQPKESCSQEKLLNWLLPEVKRLMIHASDQFSQLLYRIDVSEEQVVEILHRADIQKKDEALTRLILNRVIQKAYIRDSYTQG